MSIIWGEKSEHPVNDIWTDIVSQIYSLTKETAHWRGTHTTKCGKWSDSASHTLPNGVETNSLCVYYMQYYRKFIPAHEFEKIEKLKIEYKIVPEVEITFEHVPVVAKDRKIELETKTDVDGFHDVDAKKELEQLLVDQIATDVDKDILDSFLKGLKNE